MLLSMMNIRAILNPPTEIQRREGQLSLFYVMLLMGVVCGSFMPLAYWGGHGSLLCLWMIVVGLALIHEQLIVASMFILLGIVFSMGVELPMTEAQEQMALVTDHGPLVGDIIFRVALFVACGVFLSVAIVWALRPILLATLPNRDFMGAFEQQDHSTDVQGL